MSYTITQIPTQGNNAQENIQIVEVGTTTNYNRDNWLFRLLNLIYSRTTKFWDVTDPSGANSTGNMFFGSDPGGTSLGFQNLGSTLASYIEKTGLNNAYFVPTVTTNAATNGTNLLAALALANAASPNGSAKSATNRACVLLRPGVYSVAGGALVMNTEFVDLLAFSTAGGVTVLTSTGAGHILTQTADDVRIDGITFAKTSSSPDTIYYPSSNLPLTRMTNCEFTNDGGDGSFYWRSFIIYSGFYENLRFSTTAGGVPYVSQPATISGTMQNCDFGRMSLSADFTGVFKNLSLVGSTPSEIFGSGVTSGYFNGINANCNNLLYSTSSGIFQNINNASTGYSFGKNNQLCSGTYINCVTNGLLLGECNFTGVAISCMGGQNSMGTSVGFAGLALSCNAGNSSFGTNGAFTGTAIGCNAGLYSFAGNTIFNGTAIGCNAGDTSFGSATGGSFLIGVSGRIIGCRAGNNSFGSCDTANLGTTTISGTIIGCIGGTGCFGAIPLSTAGSSSTISGIIKDCVAGANSYGKINPGVSTGTMSGVIDNCEFSGLTDTTITGRMQNCYVKATGLNETPVIAGNGARFYDCTFIATGTGQGIGAAGAVNIQAMARANLAIAGTITVNAGTVDVNANYA